MTRSLALLVFAGLALVYSKQYDFKCPYITAKYPFDIHKYAGDWYVKAYYTSSNETFPNGKEKCNRAKIEVHDYANGDNYITKHITQFFDEKTLKTEVVLYPFTDDKSAFAYGVYKKEGTSFSGVFKRSVIVSDYDTYAVTLACYPYYEESTYKFYRKIYAEILTRDKNLSPDIYKTLKNVLTGYDVDVSRLRTVELQDC